jgi:hypothetical protein
VANLLGLVTGLWSFLVRGPAAGPLKARPKVIAGLAAQQAENTQQVGQEPAVAA